MRVFLLRADPNRPWLGVAADQESVVREVRNATKSVRSWWKPIRVERLVGDDKEVIGGMPTGPMSDFPTFTLPCFSGRAVNVLREFLEPNGELLPLLCDEGEFYAYHILTQVPALDEARSTVARIPGRIAMIHQYEFVPSLLQDLTVFRLTREQGGISLVTDPFVDRVVQTGLTGFDLREVWPTPKVPEKKVPSTAKRTKTRPFKVTERPLNQSERQAIHDAVRDGNRLVGASADESPETIVDAIDRLLATNPSHADLDDLAITLGSLFGEQLRRDLGWEWVYLRARLNATAAGEAFAIVSRDRSLAVLPMITMRKSLDPGASERGVGLLFRMLKGGYQWDTKGATAYHIVG